MSKVEPMQPRLEPGPRAFSGCVHGQLTHSLGGPIPPNLGLTLIPPPDTSPSFSPCSLTLVPLPGGGAGSCELCRLGQPRLQPCGG